MAWLVAIAVLALAVFSKGFRLVLLVIVGLVAVTGGAFYLWNQAEVSASRQRILKTEIEFEDLRMGPSRYGSSYELTGRLRNNSQQFTVTQVALAVTLRDCAIDSTSACDTVGQSETVIFLSVPPGQVRDINNSVYFGSGTRVRGKMEWSSILQTISAR